tara:strand:+ start:145 stop:288 length:144 start_codon:yes stop_codon:yes gene_type:complete
MAKYKLEVYGWEVEATGHSIADKQVKKIQDLIYSKGLNNLWEVRFNL